MMDRQHKALKRSSSLNFARWSPFKDVTRSAFSRRTVHRYPTGKSARHSIVRRTQSSSSNKPSLDTSDPLSLVKLSPILTGSFNHISIRTRSRSRSRSRSSSIFSGSFSAPFSPISPGPTSGGCDDVFFEEKGLDEVFIEETEPDEVFFAEIPVKGKAKGMLFFLCYFGFDTQISLCIMILNNIVHLPEAV